MLRVGERVFFREEHTNWLSTTKWSVLKMYTRVNITQTEQGIFRSVYVYTHTYRDVTTNSENRSCARGRRTWDGLEGAKKGKGGNDTIT